MLLVEPTSLLQGDVTLVKVDSRFLRLLKDALLRPPPNVQKVTTVKSIVLSRHPTKTMVGLTRYSRVRRVVILSVPRQTITFYSDLMDELSDSAAEGVIAHELAHAWLNEHVLPVQSAEREGEADAVAREWGFGPELDALDAEAETVPPAG